MGKGQIQKIISLQKTISIIKPKKERKCKQRCPKVKNVKLEKKNQVLSCKKDKGEMLKNYMQHFYQKESRIILQTYNKDILELYIEMDNKSILFDHDFISISTHFFDKRSFLESIDYEIQRFQGAQETFFLTSYYMDKYLNSITTVTTLTSNDYNLIGLTAFYIASKYEDLFPLCMGDLQIIVGKNKFTVQEILDKEIDFLNSIGWDLITITTFDVIKTFSVTVQLE